MDHIKTNNILISNQHGLRPGFSCQTQLISLIDDISYTMDNHCQTDLILLDFSKAFDTVPHGRLLAKLQYYKINNLVWKWIQSWLTQWTQSVVVDGASSKPTLVLSGVLQGTVLGPVMFLLYINDITDEVSSTLRLFADDCILKLNPQKTQYLFKKTLIYHLTGLQQGRWTSIPPNVLCLDVPDLLCQFYITIDSMTMY